MGITERKEREKKQMRRQIIQAAMTMFREEGYEKTSIRKIAEMIEYSPATIYLYYKDKDELLYEVQREAFDKLYKAFTTKANHPDPLTRLHQLCKTYVHFGIQHPELYDLMFIIRAPMNVLEEKHLWTNGHVVFHYLVDCLKECMDKKLLRYKDVMILALSVWSMGHGLVSLNLRCRFKVMEMNEEQISQAIDTSIEEYLRVIKA